MQTRTVRASFKHWSKNVRRATIIVVGLWDVAGEVVLTLLLEFGFIQPGLA